MRFEGARLLCGISVEVERLAPLCISPGYKWDTILANAHLWDIDTFDSPLSFP